MTTDICKYPNTEEVDEFFAAVDKLVKSGQTKISRELKTLIYIQDLGGAKFLAPIIEIDPNLCEMIIHPLSKTFMKNFSQIKNMNYST